VFEERERSAFEGQDWPVRAKCAERLSERAVLYERFLLRRRTLRGRRSLL
jgi:hypothetical protein